MEKDNLSIDALKLKYGEFNNTWRISKRQLKLLYDDIKIDCRPRYTFLIYYYTCPYILKYAQVPITELTQVEKRIPGAIMDMNREELYELIESLGFET